MNAKELAETARERRKVNGVIARMFGQLILGAVTKRLHDSNCLELSLGRGNLYRDLSVMSVP